MADGYVSIPVLVSLSVDHYARIAACAQDLNVTVDEVLRAVVNTSVRRHMDSVPVSEGGEEG